MPCCFKMDVARARATRSSSVHSRVDWAGAASAAGVSAASWLAGA